MQNDCKNNVDRQNIARDRESVQKGVHHKAFEIEILFGVVVFFIMRVSGWLRRLCGVFAIVFVSLAQMFIALVLVCGFLFLIVRVLSEFVAVTPANYCG